VLINWVAGGNMSDIKLREYQTSSIEQLEKGFYDGHVRQILAASTGAGKSIIAMSILDSANKAGLRVTFVCDRRILVDQFSLHLSRHGIHHGCVMSGHWRYKPSERVQVASIQTLERMKEWTPSDLIIVDEIHAVMRKSLKTFIENNPNTKIIGLTATPFHKELGNYFTNIVNVITMNELVEKKFLVPFRVFIAKEIDTSGVKITAGEWQKDALEERGLNIVGDVVSEYVKLSNSIFGGYKKTICFSSGVIHSKELASRFNEMGLNFVPISYLDSEEVKQQILQDFYRPDSTINGVISSDILIRGFDQTDVEHIIIARPLRKAFSMHVQMVGRGARPHPLKESCVIQDHSGNWLRFSDDWENLFRDGVKKLSSEVETRSRKEPTDREKKDAKCPSCSALWTSSDDKCDNCGFIRVKIKHIMNIPGTLEELKASNAKLQINNQEFYSQVIYYARSRGFKNGWAAHKYKEKFNVFPRGLKLDPKPPTPETLRWIKSRAIAFSKGKAKSL
jgi:superfamily II DNA or RNA helicase